MPSWKGYLGVLRDISFFSTAMQSCKKCSTFFRVKFLQNNDFQIVKYINYVQFKIGFLFLVSTDLALFCWNLPHWPHIWQTLVLLEPYFVVYNRYFFILTVRFSSQTDVSNVCRTVIYTRYSLLFNCRLPAKDNRCMPYGAFTRFFILNFTVSETGDKYFYLIF